MSDYEKIYDAAEMRGGKGFSVEGHQAGIAAVVAEAKAEALNEVADFLDGRGILWHGDSGVTVMERPYPGQLGRPYSGQLGLRLTDWLRARAVASVGNVSEILTRSEQETL